MTTSLKKLHLQTRITPKILQIAIKKYSYFKYSNCIITPFLMFHQTLYRWLECRWRRQSEEYGDDDKEGGQMKRSKVWKEERRKWSTPYIYIYANISINVIFLIQSSMRKPFRRYIICSHPHITTNALLVDRNVCRFLSSVSPLSLIVVLYK